MSKQNTEQILVIYSVEGTPHEDLKTIQESIRSFSASNTKDVKVEPKVFEIPDGAAPGASLGTELSEELTASIGAIVFVDDLKPNVAYEMGFFHGQGRTVLLLTHKDIDSIWTTISDLAGAPIRSLEKENVETVVSLYLNRLYTDISHINVRSSFPLPSNEANFLNKARNQRNQSTPFEPGPYGSSLIVRSWNPIDIDVSVNVFKGSRFIILFRSVMASADYTIYFLVRYSDRNGDRKSIWLGLSSSNRIIGVTYSERTFPAQPATREWRVLQAEFDDLLRQGHILGNCSVEFIEKVRFRGGLKRVQNPNPVEFGYLSFVGTD